MKHLSILISCLFCACGLRAQTMYVRPNIGSQSAYAVNDIQKLTFANGNLMLTPNIGSSTSFPLSTNRYVSFTDFSLSNAAVQAEKPAFVLYPNPVHNWLYVGTSNPALGMTQIEMVSVTGQIVRCSPGQGTSAQIDVSALPAGMYVCRIYTDNQSVQTLKFIKQ